MKKIFLLLSVVALTATSCKKDHVCSCTSSSTAPGSTSTTMDITIVKARKGDAKKACVKTTWETTSGGTTYVNTSDCKLK